jgi:acyl-[acyl-carrier-protein]-phospholipid O-acyltransferase/long-chain-fatty-acid--[acyl-carrier-protein] ligase
MKTFFENIIHLLVKIIVRICFKFSTDNISGIPASGPAVLALNSVSFVDPVLALAALRRPALFLVDRNDFSFSPFRPLLSLCNVLAVDFRNATDSEAARQKARGVLAHGGLVAVFPEDRISRQGFLNAFDNRCAEMAEHTDCPVIPLYIDLMRGSRHAIFGKASVVLGEGRRRHAKILCGTALDARAATPEALRKSVEELSVRAFVLRKQHRRSLGYMMIRCARHIWFQPAMMDTTGKKFTAGTRLVASLAIAKLVRKRFARESSIGILLPASAGAALLNAGVTLAGKIPVNLNFTTAQENIAFAITSCSIRTVVTSKLFLKKMPQLALPAEIVFLEDLLVHVSVFDRIVALTKGIFLPASVLVRERTIRPDDCATIVFSSGSASNPKGVMLSHHNIISNLEQMHTVFDFSRNDCMAAALPFFHSFGLTVTLWFPLIAGFRIAYHPSPLDGSVMVNLIKEQKATILPCTPTFLQTYMRKAEQRDFETLRLIISGAEKLKPQLAREFVEKFKVAPLEGYGATELSPVAALNVPDTSLWSAAEQGNRPGTIGRLLPGMCSRIVDPDTGKVLDNGKSGLLLVKGPNVMKGYLNMPQKTQEAFIDGWYSTGDIATVSADGFITLTDRLTRFSKIGGEMIPHGALEEIFQNALKTYGEQVVAVTAVPDLRRGEKLVVLYTEQAGRPEDLNRIIRDAAVPNLWKPATDAYVKVDAIPVLGTGKTDLKTVRLLACQAFSSCAG